MLRMKQSRSGNNLLKSSSSPAVQILGMKDQRCLLPARQSHICSLKNVLKTASTPYGLCLSPAPDFHRSSWDGRQTTGVRKQQPQSHSNNNYFYFLKKTFKHLLLEPFLTIPFVPFRPHFLFGCCSPRHPRSNHTEMLEGKVNSVTPSAPGLSPAALAETTGLCLAASLEKTGDIVRKLFYF